MNELNPTPINPRGFTNTNNIEGVFGRQVPNSFTRNVRGIYDTNNPMMVNPEIANPVPTPTGVETPIVPPYDINNY